ncbi:MAG: Lrp/AsnC ligand binding domain-containing protein [Planctomycetota bacterium]
MVTAFILIGTKKGTGTLTAEALTQVDGVAEVHITAGGLDLLAVIRVKTHEQLAEIVTGCMPKMENIERTQTMISFKGFSRHNLEKLFST